MKLPASPRINAGVTDVRIPSRAGLLWILAASACSNEPEIDVGGLTDALGTSGFASGSSSGVPDSGDVSESGGAGTSAADASTGGTGYSPPLLDVGSAETGGVSESCVDAPDEIHVLAGSNEVWAFHIEDLTFTLVTDLNCPELATAIDISSFTIDRDGMVWTLSRHPEDAAVGPYWPMQVTRFNPTSHACDVQWYGGLVSTDGQSVDCADVAFVSMPQDPSHERLFMRTCTGGGFIVQAAPGTDSLFRLDPATDPPLPVALSADVYSSAPIAGTGDGHLYAVSGDAESPGSTVILEYDQDTGAILQTTSAPEIDLGDSAGQLALAFYGGDLVAFSFSGIGLSAELLIHRYDLDDDDGNGVHEVVPLEPAGLPFESWSLVAAASPTCIPTGPAG